MGDVASSQAPGHVHCSGDHHGCKIWQPDFRTSHTLPDKTHMSHGKLKITWMQDKPRAVCSYPEVEVGIGTEAMQRLAADSCPWLGLS